MKIKTDWTPKTNECGPDGCQDEQESHSCPYHVEINDDDDFQCRCCRDCALACQDEI